MKATEEVGTGLVLTTKNVAKGIIFGVAEVGGDIVSAATQTVKTAISSASSVGGDVAMVTKKTIEGVVEATSEIGGNIEEVVKATSIRAIETAYSIGNVALNSVKEILLLTIGGIKEVLGSILPTSKSSEIKSSLPNFKEESKKLEEINEKIDKKEKTE